MSLQRRFMMHFGPRGATHERGFWSPTLTAKDPSIPWLPLETPSAAFPTQYLGLRMYDGAATVDLCLVAEGDAPTGMGGVVKAHKGGTTYAVYLVETGDANASKLRLRSATGIKAIRLKT